MARPKSPMLTDAELRLMEVLWDRGPSTVGEVTEALPKGVELAYSSVLTTLRILEQKGYARHEKRGRAFVYAPLIRRRDAQKSAVRHLLGRFFEDSPELLVLNVLEDERLSAAELRKLRKMIEEAE
ncbi:MAG: BlaI/MecI/CopY family transcriptional regulator [Bryobacteraceae bacterium]|nr:BlaI/MecI/CopY family transcriptional regulator [Bryobacteraceae bacterium]HEU0141619.1 BlaI/MecI/CopY family transcriptional regulator [Bryobacteraceae bacterium]